MRQLRRRRCPARPPVEDGDIGGMSKPARAGAAIIASTITFVRQRCKLPVMFASAARIAAGLIVACAVAGVRPVASTQLPLGTIGVFRNWIVRFASNPETS